MVEKKPVSVNWQTLFAIIPIIDLWAAYRIEKLVNFIFIIIGMFIVSFIVGFAEGLMFLGFSDASTWIMPLIGMVVSIYFIRKWSEEWNEKFDKDSGNDKFTEEGVDYKLDNDDDSPDGVTYKKD